MKTTFEKSRLAVAFVFFCPGLAYGLFTSRLPAIKLQSGIDEGEIGLALLVLGACCFFSLMLLPRFLSRFPARAVVLMSLLGTGLGLLLASSSSSLHELVAGTAVTGLSIGLCDGAMNVMGSGLERTSKRSVMSYFHAFYSLGAVAASILCYVLAGAGIGAFENAALGAAGGAMLILFSARHLPAGEGRSAKTSESGNKLPDNGKMPLMLLVLGVMTTCAYASEGAVGEWGALLLTEKGASEQHAALVYGSFSVAVTAVRLVVDKLRMSLKDQHIVAFGMLAAAVGLALGIFSQHVAISYVGFLLAGAGISPLSPILFSLAGRVPGVSPAKGVSTVALFSYSGLLVFPPFIGSFARHASVGTALCTVFALLAVTAILSCLLPKGGRGESQPWN